MKPKRIIRISRGHINIYIEKERREGWHGERILENYYDLRGYDMSMRYRTQYWMKRIYRNKAVIIFKQGRSIHLPNIPNVRQIINSVTKSHEQN